MVPRERLVARALSADVPVRIDAFRDERRAPDIGTKGLGPPVETRACLPRLVNHPGKSPVATREDVDRAGLYAGAADLVLFDAKTPGDATRPGGMGLSFDWSLVAGWKGSLPWGLAGGLTPDNVAEAVRMTGAPLVDTSSGVESSPGVKDRERIMRFAAAVRGN